MNVLFFIKKILFFVLFMVIVDLAYAADLSITPAVVNIVAYPVSKCESRYILTNVSDNAVTVVVTKENWKNFSGNSSNVSVDSWLEIEKDKFDIGPKESVEVPFKVIVVKEMVGSVSGMIVFSIKGTMIDFSMKHPVYVIIKGTEQIDFKIDSLSIGTSKRDGSIYYNMVIKNDGNVHIRHNGVVEIYNKKTGDLVRNVVIEETFPVYAEDSRTFSGVILKAKSLEKGKYVALFKIKALGKEVIKKVKFKVSKLGEVIAG